MLGLADCKPCYLGSFQELSGGHNCSLTHAGYYPRQDRAAQIPCDLGAYADVRGLETCKFCQKGQFADTVGRHACSLCPGGHAAPQRGATLCDACLPGSFTNETGSEQCKFKNFTDSLTTIYFYKQNS